MATLYPGSQHSSQVGGLSHTSIRASIALAATLSNTELKDDSENEDDEILSAFTATVNTTKGIVEDVDEKEDLVESKFEKMD
ncbi:hypothetical protein SO802_024602 [Lithocarpus litseifolius]|uniref:Uncharacterized protein n=1 Tax=Lithocarpus litseifolius TaxID=425828 RepID=A0AAW2C9J0_9ROSI